MEKIFALTDYKGNFGSKHFDDPYRSGLDKKLLNKYFLESGYVIDFVRLSDIFNSKSSYSEAKFIYTSSEDDGYFYKSFIEDIVLTLENAGSKIIPGYKYLRANNNKVFMELMRKSLDNELFNTLESLVFGSFNEMHAMIDTFKYPLVIKTAEGASGSGVFKADNRIDLERIAKKISRTKNISYELWDLARPIKHKGYIKDSRYRRKFILQNFISNLKNDWKIYIFGEKYYIFYRPVFKHRGFRASGGGYDNYFYDEKAPKEIGIFDFAKKVMNSFNTPHISLDVAFDGQQFHLIEFQFLYFGTAGIPYSKGYYMFENGEWIFKNEILDIERVYVDSIVSFDRKS